MGKQFSLKNQVLLLTYKTHIDKDDLEEFLDGLFDCRIEGCYIAHEMGDSECGYEHTHVAIRWERAIQTKDERKFDYDGIHPHIKPVKGRNGWNDAVKYVSKEDDALVDTKDGLMGRKRVASLLADSHDIRDALGLADKFSDIPGIIAGYNIMRGCMEVECDEEPHPWQQDLRDFIKSTNRKRGVVWVRGRVGNEGKSTWATNRRRLDGALVILGGTTLDNYSNLVYQWINRGNKLDMVIFDLARENEESGGLYKLIENTKNGYLMSAKYQGSWIDFGHTYVVVFANFDPILSKLSDDRWLTGGILDIVKNESGELTLYNATSDVFDSQKKTRADGKIICFE